MKKHAADSIARLARDLVDRPDDKDARHAMASVLARSNHSRGLAELEAALAWAAECDSPPYPLAERLYDIAHVALYRSMTDTVTHWLPASVRVVSVRRQVLSLCVLDGPTLDIEPVDLMRGPVRCLRRLSDAFRRRATRLRGNPLQHERVNDLMQAAEDCNEASNRWTSIDKARWWSPLEDGKDDE